jgi:hypothetical protein
MRPSGGHPGYCVMRRFDLRQTDLHRVKDRPTVRKPMTPEADCHDVTSLRYLAGDGAERDRGRGYELER